MRLKVMTYNLLYGFHERTDKTLLYREERARAAQTVVRDAAPDVLALTEAAYCGAAGRIVRHDFETMFGLPHVAATGFEGEWASALVSRFPITRVERLPLGSSPSGIAPSALRATLNVGGRALHIDVVHPSPHVPEAERVAAFAPLLATLQTPYIMLGDFNALSDEDEYTAEQLLGQMLDHVIDKETVVTAMLDRQLVASLRERGLVDTLAPPQRGHTIPTRLDRGARTQGAQIRIDYIFASSELRVVESEIVRRSPADEVSDHYPVVATLELV